MTSRHVLIIDDHPLFRDAMKGVLASVLHNAEIHEAASLEESARILAGDFDFELALLDLKMPGVQGLSGLAYFRAQFPAVPVVIVSGQEEPAVIRRALALGASGFIPKSSSADDMRKAVQTVLDGEVWSPAISQVVGDDEREVNDLTRRLATLTPQQVRVLMMLRSGLLNKQIAYELDVSEATVKAHVSAILLKLNVDSRTQAVIAAGRIDGESISET